MVINGILNTAFPDGYFPNSRCIQNGLHTCTVVHAHCENTTMSMTINYPYDVYIYIILEEVF